MSTVHSASQDRVNSRIGEIKRVLWVILFLNIGVASAKLAWGIISGSVAMAADGFHSMFDGAGNIIGLVGMGFASRPADDDHPYGHGKYETYAAVVIGAMLLLAAYSIGSTAVARLAGGGQPVTVTTMSFLVMLGTLTVNIFVAIYERKEGKRLNSSILIADASHTASDVLVSIGVLLSLVAVKMGFESADAIISLIIAGVILYTAWGVFKTANTTLSDTARIPTTHLAACAMKVQGILDTHHIRTRGTDAEVYVDLHVMVDPAITVARGHELAHAVEDCILDEYPQVIDIVIHVEPYGEHYDSAEHK